MSALQAFLNSNNTSEAKLIEDLTLMTALPPTPATDATITERLQSWTQYWPPSRIGKDTYHRSMLPSLGEHRRPPIAAAQTKAGPKAPFTYADIPALIEAINDQSVCRWIDAYRPRQVGDNALRALAGLCYGDPRLLVQRNPNEPWNQEARQATAQALAVWWRNGPSELTPEELPVFIRQQMLDKVPISDLAMAPL